MNENSQRFDQSLRLRKSPEFQRVYSRKISVADATLIVYALPNEQGVSRLGLAVSRRIGNAVVRNRWKRLIREAFRRLRAEMPRDLDLIVLPKRGAEVPDFTALNRSLKTLLKRLEKKIARFFDFE